VGGSVQGGQHPVRWRFEGWRMRASREELGLTQTEVGRVLGVGQAAISQWEIGESRPGARNLVLLCELFGLKPLEMLV
jgi:transcriptional regulator with XRE-family HTH domain